MTQLQDVNFDGLIGPSHNYAGLSLGNVASAANRGAISRPRAAALQGLRKMHRLVAMGLAQGVLPPQDRPETTWLRSLGFTGDDDTVCAEAWRADPALLRNALSASAMWTANAATVSPSPDTADGRCHLSVANLATMPHRALEAGATLATLRTVFADDRHFQVHGPVPSVFGDEGAANHMRLSAPDGDAALEIFVYGARTSGGFPARQDRRASEAVARRHGLSPERRMMVQQSDAAIQAGAFHNDVVAVSNGHVLLVHEQAFVDPQAVYAEIRARLPGAVIIEASAAAISLESAVASYLFNAQLVTLPDGDMALIAPTETRDGGPVEAWLKALAARGGPVKRVIRMDVRESMRNGGGPACLRLRVPLTSDQIAAVDRRYLLDAERIDAIATVVEAHWPETLAPEELGHPDLWRRIRSARAALHQAVDL